MENKIYSYKYPHPAVTTDCVVFGFDGCQLNILLIERGNEPYKGCWAFPGGFMNMDETAEEGAMRELNEETGLKLTQLKQFGAFTAVNRDPRERVVTIAFYALTKKSDVQGGDDAAKARWFPLDEMPTLAFDHDNILQKAIEQMKKDIYFESLHRITPERITKLDKNEIFVFGSNLEGAHGGGAAWQAYREFGAIMGQGVGLQGQSYGIPTMHGGPKDILPYVEEFIEFAKQHPELTFLVTKIGCGIAGFMTKEIAPLFVGAVDVKNIFLPQDFWKELI
ncbi:MAG: NUDIX domain-containing protein [Bacteroidales bacterium]|nr:NUDIX domain-containing protein [Bacteroidales bacterium]